MVHPRPPLFRNRLFIYSTLNWKLYAHRTVTVSSRSHSPALLFSFNNRWHGLYQTIRVGRAKASLTQLAVYLAVRASMTTG